METRVVVVDYVANLKKKNNVVLATLGSQSYYYNRPFSNNDLINC